MAVIADAAFKNLSNAYEVIFDEAKRVVYDFKMGYNATTAQPQPQPPSQNGTSYRSRTTTGSTRYDYYDQANTVRAYSRYTVTRFSGGRARWEPEYWSRD